MNRIKVIDQMQRTVELPSTVLRIVSLVPSQTELLVDMGLREQLVGVTKFCIHPQDLRKEMVIVGGTKQVDIEKVRALKPDIIIGNKEENKESNIRELEKLAPVWMSDIFTLNDSLEMLEQFGLIFNKEGKAKELRDEIQQSFNACAGIFKDLSNKVHYFIWRNPYMAAGKNTFIDFILTHLGLQNCETEVRYPEVKFNSLKKDVDFVFLSSEPYPFGEKHFVEFQENYPNAKIFLVDGEMFSWYGSRLRFLNKYLQQDLLPKINAQAAN